MATRKASLQSLNQLGPLLPELIGGSADLAGSNYTIWNGSKPISRKDANGNYIYYGVREFGMSAISNGIALHGGFKTYTGTFLVFADYMRNGMRMSALMKQPVTYVLTHDSIGLGEDGPTHQPVEHVASLRLIPNMSVWLMAATKSHPSRIGVIATFSIICKRTICRTTRCGTKVLCRLGMYIPRSH